MVKVKKYFGKVIKRIKDDIKEYYGLVLAIVLYLFVMYSLFKTFCPVYAFTHFPCPGCGLTRGCICILRLDFKAMLRYHACAPLWMGLIIYSMICRYIFLTNIKKWNLIAGIVSAITILYYINRFIERTLPY